jgi:ankyrin repeat protein
MDSTSPTFCESSESSDSNSVGSDDPNETLVDAAAAGDLARLNEAVLKGAYIDYRSPRELRSGINILAVGKGNSALHMACYKSFRPIIERLLELGANYDIKSTQNGSTPLHYASYNGDGDVVELLLGRGSNLHEKTVGWGRTPLHSASSNGQSGVVKLQCPRGRLDRQFGPHAYLPGS